MIILKEKIKQYQRVTPKVFDGIVRDAIDRWFKLEYLKDQRLPGIFEEAPEKELREEAYSIFFKSFSDILENIGIARSKQKALEITLTYWNSYHDIKSYDINIDNFPDIAKSPTYYSNSDSDEEEEEKYDMTHREILKSVFGKDTKVKDLNNVKIRFKVIYLWFWSWDKKQGQAIKYRVSLEERIKTITDYVLTKAIANRLLKASRGMKYKTEKKRTHDGFYEMDMYNYVRIFAEDYSSTIKSFERRIWQPRIETESDRSWTKKIGSSFY
jgi:hypothetical protein